MIRLLQWLIFGHVHEWEKVEQVTVNGHPGNGGGRWQAVYLQCKTCGNYKYKEMK